MPTATLPAPSSRRLPWAGAALLLLVLAWDASGLDLPLAHLAGDAKGFAWRDAWLLQDVLHEGGRRAGWLLALLLCAGVWWPVGPLKRLTLESRFRLAGGVLLSAAVVSVAKLFSATSCPWDLREFGGWTPYVPHWSWLADGGRGQCFPAGHAASGFSFLGGFFAFDGQAPGLARAWLAASLAAGLLLGVAQQLRGAHFMSHTLWSAWICWCVSALIHRGGGRPA